MSIVNPGCNFCPSNNDWGANYRQRYGVPQTVPVTGLPPTFYLAHDIQPIGGAHFLLCAADHYVSSAELPRNMPIEKALQQSLAHMRQAYGPDKDVLVFEHRPGHIEGTPVACGGCHTEHNHVHLITVPESARFEIGGFRSVVERQLTQVGWSDIAARRVESSHPLAGLGDTTSGYPYLHWGVFRGDGTSYASTYVQTSLQENLPSRFFQRVVATSVFRETERLTWGHDHDFFVAPPGHVPLGEITPVIKSAGLARSVPGSVTPEVVASIEEPAIAIKGVSGTGKSHLGRQLARHLGWRFFDSGYLMRALVLMAKEQGIAELDPAAMAALGSTLDIEINANARPGRWLVKVDGRVFTETQLKAVSAVGPGIFPALEHFTSQWVRRFAAGGRVVLTGRSTELRLPRALVPVVFELWRSPEQSLFAPDTNMERQMAESRLMRRLPMAHNRPGQFPSFVEPSRTYRIGVTGPNGEAFRNDVLSEMISTCRSVGIGPRSTTKHIEL